jgi:cytochrome c553
VGVRKLIDAVLLSAMLPVLGSLAALPALAQTAAVKEQLPTCLVCHGENGQSQAPDVPSLGGQQAFYVTVQLLMFREKMRVAEPMNDMATGLTDDDLRAFADVFAASPPPQSAAGPADEARMQRGRALVQRDRCNFCHKQDFSGQDNVPRIGAQREDYLVKALRGYKDNSRHGYDTAMADVIAPITDAEILDLAYYIARAQ